MALGPRDDFYYWDINRQVDKNNVPANYMPIYDKDLPINLDVDLVICQDVEAQYSISRKFCDFWHIPLLVMIDKFKKTHVNFNADIIVYPSYEIQESWGIIGSVVEPGYDCNFSTINHSCEAKRNLLVADVRHEKDLLLCREIISKTDFTIETCKTTKYERYEQYQKAQGYINIYDSVYPIGAIEALVAGLPVISVPNPHLEPYINQNMGTFFKTTVQAKMYISNLDRMIVKPIQYRTLEQYSKDFNTTLQIFNDFIFDKG